MTEDPPVREDGLCYVCEKSRPHEAVRQGDPFCKLECCRIYHGHPLPVGLKGKR